MLIKKLGSNRGPQISAFYQYDLVQFFHWRHLCSYSNKEKFFFLYIIAVCGGGGAGRWVDGSGGGELMR